MDDDTDDFGDDDPTERWMEPDPSFDALRAAKYLENFPVERWAPSTR
jgi:hypothetical protein